MLHLVIYFRVSGNRTSSRSPTLMKLQYTKFYNIFWKCEILECAPIRLYISLSGLSFPKTDFIDCCYICKYIIRKSDRNERVAAENVMNLPQSILCDNHLENMFINRTICRVFFLYAQKLVNSQVRREVAQQLKEEAK